MSQANPEAYIALTEVQKILNRKIHLNTVHRWCLSGVRGHRLRSQIVGGRRFTTAAWVREFIAALNDQPAPPRQRPDLDAACRAAGV